MRGIVEGFEGNYVIIEIDGETRDVDRSAVKFDVEVGDCVIFQEGTWVVDSKATEERARHMKKLMEDVWND
ncbi:DUF3006 domain-containing protein [Paenibacillus hemerocallicola]|uniref:DUF3006 domain-containing protein n=1 Tax=Paenibacillus hemerocallicola TaxID=1172614 RepID=A0A5C4T0G0_9BACL|nr:DUF3006 domain-containing protein [Paenibacillus hemerocallicola]TNJ61393.1 DUF3006 domain-containing protein [Paenibacillus hemerocallicola]